MKPLQRTLATITTFLFAVTIGSCSKDKAPESADTRSAQEQQASPTMPSGMPGAGGAMKKPLRAACPMLVQGADVTVADIEGGVALTFTTNAGDVADLRSRVRNMAQMYEMHRGQGRMMWQHMGGESMARGGPGMGMGHMAGRGPMPAASTNITDIDLGARLEIRPTDPSRLDALREHVRWHQERMHSGECWMLKEQPTETSPQEQE